MSLKTTFLNFKQVEDKTAFTKTKKIYKTPRLESSVIKSTNKSNKYLISYALSLRLDLMHIETNKIFLLI